MPFRVPVNRTKFSKSDYKEPTNLEEHKRELLSTGQATIYQILNEMDVDYGMSDGFNYGSYGRYATSRNKHIRKPVGPLELYRAPPAESMKCGFWMADSCLRPEDPWYQPRQRYARWKTDVVQFVDAALKIDKMFKC
ncbi:uncharacterized protein LOC123319757 [Coccinella septempunctata]|uniref:uncharacterized protein LOC123319757 n=1 Tax=Coccinella septempunctata TaxID=41139 RepID=UPI001D066649|nr:uncharacterized protein LOC123319757 [Coccinella septempunctata]